MLNLRQTIVSRGAAVARPVRLLVAAAALCLCCASGAAAHDCSAGPHRVIAGPITYWDFMTNPLNDSYGDSSCWVMNGMNAAYMSCYSWPGWEFGGGWSNSMSWSHTVTSSDPGSSAQWTAQIYYDFDDPNNSFYNQFSAQVRVWRNGSLVQQVSIVQRTGSSGIDEYCASASASVTPSVGDVVEINISGGKLSANALIHISNVHLWRV